VTSTDGKHTGEYAVDGRVLIVRFAGLEERTQAGASAVIASVIVGELARKAGI
jgi:hypothetical protein